MYTYIKVATL